MGELRTQRPRFSQRANSGGVQTRALTSVLSHARGVCRQQAQTDVLGTTLLACAAPTRGIPAFASEPASLGSRTPRPLPPPRVSLARP